MLKAVREAKVRSSWINPNTAYEEALAAFVRSVREDPEKNVFLAHFRPFQARIARVAMYNSLAQILLKFMVPGVPDIYQGNELWDFSLVDPDNRTNPWAPLSGKILRWYCLCTSQDPIRTSLPVRSFTLKQVVEHVVSRLWLYLPISRSRFLLVSLENKQTP
jgi:hypothetical protein